jgi:hypothetical protein
MTTLFLELLRKRNQSIVIAVITNARFGKCATADTLPKGTAETRKEFDRLFEQYKTSNVADVSEVLDITLMYSDQGYYEWMRSLLRNSKCDVAIISAVPEQ